MAAGWRFYNDDSLGPLAEARWGAPHINEGDRLVLSLRMLERRVWRAHVRLEFCAPVARVSIEACRESISDAVHALDYNMSIVDVFRGIPGADEVRVALLSLREGLES